MNSWPRPFVPDLPIEISLPHLSLFDSYQGAVKPVDIEDPFTMYVCGITPYDATHIGHASTYLAFDLIHRYLSVAGRKVRFLENVTDIDDPLFERARRDGSDWRNLGDSQLRLFVSDMTNLRVLPPENLISVTEAMEQIIEFISSLISSGLTYSIGDDLYLDSARVTDFGDLPLSLEEAIALFRERGGDPDRTGKRHSLDPVLWRKSQGDEPSWSTPFGVGRPGWHVECNAISSDLLEGGRKTISLQGGGSDLIFPHHYMTGLQGRAHSGAPFSRNFVHAGMIRYQGEKMSKSLGNLVFVSNLVDSGVSPMAIRIALMMGHYRNERDWSEELLQEGQAFLARLLEVLSREKVKDYANLMNEIAGALASDLDTPSVFSALDAYIEKSDQKAERSPGALSRFLDALLGITL